MRDEQFSQTETHNVPRVSTMGWLEYVIGGAAVAISTISLWVALKANDTQDRLLAASTWPIVQFSTGNRLDDGVSAITLTLQNAGVGPARVKSVQIFHNEVAHPDAAALITSCCDPPKGIALNTITSDPARVLVASEEVKFLRFDEATADPKVWANLNRERFRLRVLACYCSVLGDCWKMDSTKADPDPIAACPVIPEAQRWHG